MSFFKQHKLPLIAGSLLLAASGAYAAPDWSKVPKRNVQVFHAGVTPIEWIMDRTHGGRTGLKKGETCIGCHEDEEVVGKLNFDTSRLSGELEPVGAPKTVIYPVAVQTAYDAQNLHLRLTFKAPTGGFNADNAIKVTVLFPNAKVPQATQSGCWATCHVDLRTMPKAASETKTKYVEGAYDLMQWASKDNKVSDGSVSAERRMSGGSLGAKAEATEKDGEYTVTFTRSNPGEGKSVPFGFAIHFDHASGRFHHVSLGYLIGIGADGDLKAVKQ
jgi:hypothetical protein